MYRRYDLVVVKVKHAVHGWESAGVVAAVGLELWGLFLPWCLMYALSK